MKFNPRRLLKVLTVIFVLLCLNNIIYYFYHTTKVQKEKGIAILVVLTKDSKEEEYKVALGECFLEKKSDQKKLKIEKDSHDLDRTCSIYTLRCYSQIQSYQFIIARDTDYLWCNQSDVSLKMHFSPIFENRIQKFFRRHCVAAKILPNYDALLFLDADIGVVNPKKRIEDYLPDGVDVVLYDRFYNWEVAAGSYIVRNSPYAVAFLEEWSNYASKLPSGFHGTDNGAIHMLLAEKLFPHSKIQVELCRKIYNMSKNYDDLFTYEACIQNIFGENQDFGKVRILKKGTGWVRDCWLTSCQWHPDLDFMLHGWKSSHLKKIFTKTVRPNQMNRSTWYNPIHGEIDLAKCHPGNQTWSYNPKLMGDKSKILESLTKFEESVALQQVKSYTRIVEMLQNK
ncbi:hypothetical protein CAEBREN_12788 [Caenorhabditis brenneri]|uniref:Nucleotide-diphospho-sugar transferase domain-containing protein n=1 Tax=Caenorhabditis brenneri TaxID=135651 RepID=G0M9Q5_CAEBE|nr:hypothetical protein CAEBREN_12788 [Caenorhabditis brenneri]